jgi:hypothetical protein
MQGSRIFFRKGGLYQCPVCDFYALRHRLGWAICPVCFWEDDASASDAHVVDVDELSVPSENNNGLTLLKARRNFKQLGAVEERLLEFVCSLEECRKFVYEPRQLGRTQARKKREDKPRATWQTKRDREDTLVG